MQDGVARRQTIDIRVVAAADDPDHGDLKTKTSAQDKGLPSRQALFGQRQPAQLVVRVGIDPRVEEDDIRPDAGQQRRQDPLQLRQIVVIAGPIGEFDIEVAHRFPMREVLLRMHREGEDAGIALEDPRRAVALVDVEVDDQHRIPGTLGGSAQPFFAGPDQALLSVAGFIKQIQSFPVSGTYTATLPQLGLDRSVLALAIAIERALAFIEERLNGEDGLGAIYPPMANIVMMYEALGKDENFPPRAITRRASCTVRVQLWIAASNEYLNTRKPCAKLAWSIRAASIPMNPC